jgi:dihydroflavonol-4-reductase
MSDLGNLQFEPGSVALVTGATGFTGSVLVRMLLERGVSVRAIARSTSKLGDFNGQPVEWITGQVYDADTVEKAVRGVHYIFHVAAAYREAKITDEIYRLVHIESTKLLAVAAAGEPGFKRFVHISTVGVHGHIDDPPADEQYRFAPGDIYQRTKADAEGWVREFAKSSGLPLAVVRPAAIYGPGDKRLLKVFRMAKRRIFPLFGRGKGLYHLIHVEDLAEIFIRASLHPRAVGEVFIGGNSTPSNLREMGTVIAAEIGNSSMRFVRFPVWPLFLLADLCELLCKPIGIEPPIYRRRVAFFTKDRAFDTRKVHSLLGFQERYSNEAGLRSTARWYKDKGWL